MVSLVQEYLSSGTGEPSAQEAIVHNKLHVDVLQGVLEHNRSAGSNCSTCREQRQGAADFESPRSSTAGRNVVLQAPGTQCKAVACALHSHRNLYWALLKSRPSFAAAILSNRMRRGEDTGPSTVSTADNPSDAGEGESPRTARSTWQWASSNVCNDVPVLAVWR